MENRCTDPDERLELLPTISRPWFVYNPFLIYLDLFLIGSLQRQRQWNWTEPNGPGKHTSCFTTHIGFLCWYKYITLYMASVLCVYIYGFSFMKHRPMSVACWCSNLIWSKVLFIYNTQETISQIIIVNHTYHSIIVIKPNVQ